LKGRERKKLKKKLKGGEKHFIKIKETKIDYKNSINFENCQKLVHPVYDLPLLLQRMTDGGQ